MQLIKAKKEHIPELVKISKEAFDSDTTVGADAPGGPPEYDSVSWHMQMMEEEHLLAAVEEGETEEIVGGAIIFPDEKSRLMYIGRIFVNPKLFRRGYGARIMERLEELYPGYSVWKLDTPAWNRRTNSFYPKLGYAETHRDGGCVYYQKVKTTPLQYTHPCATPPSDRIPSQSIQ